MKPFRSRALPNVSRFATLDMRGRLRLDVKGAIAAGLYDAEIAAARRLASILRAKKERGTP